MEELKQNIQHINSLLPCRKSLDICTSHEVDYLAKRCKYLIIYKLIDLSEAILTLSKENTYIKSAAIPILHRSFCERFIDLLLLLSDYNYVFTLIYDDACELIKFYEEVSKEYKGKLDERNSQKVTQEQKQYCEEKYPNYAKQFSFKEKLSTCK